MHKDKMFYYPKIIMSHWSFSQLTGLSVNYRRAQTDEMRKKEVGFLLFIIII